MCRVMGQRDFFISQITGGIRCPNIAADSFGPHPEITPANIQPAARGASSFHIFFLFFQLAHQRFGGVHPDLRKGPVLYIAKAVVTPELIGIHLAIPADASDTAAGIVAFIPF